MAGNTRGKLKECVEGIHRNCEWIKQHCSKAMLLLPDGYEELEESFGSLAKISDQLDEFASALYSRI